MVRAVALFADGEIVFGMGSSRKQLTAMRCCEFLTDNIGCPFSAGEHAVCMFVGCYCAGRFVFVQVTYRTNFPACETVPGARGLWLVLQAGHGCGRLKPDHGSSFAFMVAVTPRPVLRARAVATWGFALLQVQGRCVPGIIPGHRPT